jgi:hypothetical protein
MSLVVTQPEAHPAAAAEMLAFTRLVTARACGGQSNGSSSGSGSAVDVSRWVGEGEVPGALVRAHQIAAPFGH